MPRVGRTSNFSTPLSIVTSSTPSLKPPRSVRFETDPSDLASMVVNQIDEALPVQIFGERGKRGLRDGEVVGHLARRLEHELGKGLKLARAPLRLRNERTDVIVRDAEEARNAVNRFIDQGASVIKVYFRLPLGLIRVVTETAHARGVPVTV